MDEWVIDVIEDEFEKFWAEDYPTTAEKVKRLQDSLIARLKGNSLVN